MPSPKGSCHRRDEENHINKGRRLLDKASSFHGRASGPAAEMLPLPNLLAEKRWSTDLEPRRRLTKLLLHVTVLRSPGALHVLMPPEATVEDLIEAAMREYAKEARQPLLPWAHASGFNLHYSQFSLQRLQSVTDTAVLTGLNRKHKLMELGSRYFFLCPINGGGAAITNCSKEVDKKGQIWVKFMDLLLS